MAAAMGNCEGKKAFSRIEKSESPDLTTAASDDGHQGNLQL